MMHLSVVVLPPTPFIAALILDSDDFGWRNFCCDRRLPPRESSSASTSSLVTDRLLMPASFSTSISCRTRIAVHIPRLPRVGTSTETLWSSCHRIKKNWLLHAYMFYFSHILVCTVCTCHIYACMSTHIRITLYTLCFGISSTLSASSSNSCVATPLLACSNCSGCSVEVRGAICVAKKSQHWSSVMWESHTLENCEKKS